MVKLNIIRKENSPENIAMIRQLALSLIFLEIKCDCLGIIGIQSLT
jgi:hypothetical protein